MWEYRLVWDSEPDWWKTDWLRGMEYVKHTSQSIEERPDLYVVLKDRVDIGLKLRGGGVFEIKILHRRLDGWELWEKIVIEEWNSLEAFRFATALRGSAPAKPQRKGTPIEGAEAMLSDLGISFKQVKVHKKRIQAPVEILLGEVEGRAIYPNWLAELVEVHLPERAAPVFSLCFETLEPLRGSAEPIPRGNASCYGYPELLSRHIQETL